MIVGEKREIYFELFKGVKTQNLNFEKNGYYKLHLVNISPITDNRGRCSNIQTL